MKKIFSNIEADFVRLDMTADVISTSERMSVDKENTIEDESQIQAPGRVKPVEAVIPSANSLRN